MEVKENTLYEVSKKLLPKFSEYCGESLKEMSKEVYSSFTEKSNFLLPYKQLLPFFYSDLASSKLTYFIYDINFESLAGKPYRNLVLLKVGLENELYKQITGVNISPLQFLREKSIINNILYLEQLKNPYSTEPNIRFLKDILKEIVDKLKTERFFIFPYYSEKAFEKLKTITSQEFSEELFELSKIYHKECVEEVKKELHKRLMTGLFLKDFADLLEEIEEVSLLKRNLKESLNRRFK